MSDEQNQPQLGLERIYTKDISFEVPNTEVFTKQWQPETDVSISTSVNDLDEDYKEIIQIGRASCRERV